MFATFKGLCSYHVYKIRTKFVEKKVHVRIKLLYESRCDDFRVNKMPNESEMSQRWKNSPTQERLVSQAYLFL
jgi:hypothetical protein